MIPHMDKVYQERTGKTRNQYQAKDIVYFFLKNVPAIVDPRPANCGTFFSSKCVLDEDRDYKLFCYIADNVVNGLKHDGAIRKNIELTKEYVDGMTLSFPIASRVHANGNFQSVSIAVHLWWTTVESKINVHYETDNSQFAYSMILLANLRSDMGNPDIKTFMQDYRQLCYEEWSQVNSETVVSDSRDY